MYRAKVLQLYIGWVADHRVKAAPCMNFGESRPPIERVNPFLFAVLIERQVDIALEEIGADQRVALTDVLVKRGQWFVATGRVQP